MSKLTTLTAVAFQLLVCNGLLAQSFYKHFLPYPSQANSSTIYPTSDGGQIITANMNPLYLLYKLDNHGNLQWAKNGYKPLKTVQSSTGSYFMTAFYGGTKQWVAKANPDGSQAFYKGYHYGTVPFEINNICPANDGGFFLVGGPNGSAGLVKCDSTGNVQWAKGYAPNSTYIWNMIPAVGGGNNYVAMAEHGNTDYYTCFEIDGSNGNIIWYDNFQTAEGGVFPQNLDIGYQGNGYVIGNTHGATGSDTMQKVYLTSIDSSGAVRWHKTFLPPFRTELRNLTTNTNGDALISGAHVINMATGNTDMMYFLVDNTGTLQWSYTSAPVRTFGVTAPQTGVQCSSPSGTGFVLGLQNPIDALSLALINRTGTGFCNRTSFTMTTGTPTITLTHPIQTAYNIVIDTEALTPLTITNYTLIDSSYCSTLEATAINTAPVKTMLYPNPAANEVTIATGDASWQHIQLMDLSGKTIISVRNDEKSASVTLSLHDVPAGFYLVLVAKDDGTTEAVKLAVSR